MHQGQRKDTDEEMAGLVRYFGLAFLIIIMIIMLYFKSFSQGLIILMMIPFGVLGALWGHSIHGVQFSLMSLWGVVALSGTIINDAIVFLSKYNSNLREGMPMVQAIREAGRRRFRAIVLTTITTTAGLMPLILEGSADAQFLIPMAISLAYGILFGTFFILMILPHYVLMINRFKCWWQKLRTGNCPAPEEVEVAVIHQKIESTLKNAMEKEI
jgi:multidrug efflux pump subunit AcrB